MTTWTGQRGFTLIELMLVLGIVGVLAALSVPIYQHYSRRAKVSEGLVLAEPLKQAVGAYYNVHGHLPDASGSNWEGVLKTLGMPDSSQSGAASGRYVEKIWWYNGDNPSPGIRIKYKGGSLDGKRLYLQASFGAGAIRWVCTAPAANGVPADDVPASCS